MLIQHRHRQRGINSKLQTNSQISRSKLNASGVRDNTLHQHTVQWSVVVRPKFMPGLSCLGDISIFFFYHASALHGSDNNLVYKVLAVVGLQTNIHTYGRKSVDRKATQSS